MKSSHKSVLNRWPAESAGAASPRPQTHRSGRGLPGLGPGHPRVLPAVLALSLALTAHAAPDALLITNDVATARGNQSGGIASAVDFNSPPITTLNVHSLSQPIQPGPATPGVLFRNSSGGNVFINSGDGITSTVIKTSGAGGAGILAESTGTPPLNPPDDPFLLVPNPTASTNGGGQVRVTNQGEISTSGNNAPGIVAKSSATGYPDSVLQELHQFTDEGFSFAVNWVGTLTNTTDPVFGTLRDPNGVALPGSGGLFVIAPDGSFGFNLGTNFDFLAVGQSAQATVNYGVLGVNRNNYLESIPSMLTIWVTRDTNGVLNWEPGVFSTRFEARVTPVLPGTPGALFPDLTNYVARLVDTASAGGGGDWTRKERSEEDWNVFVYGSGQLLDVESTANAEGYNIETGGATVGVDRRLGPSFALGLAAGYVGHDADLANGGEVAVNGGRASLYATWFGEAAFLEGAVGGGVHYFDTRRVAVGGEAAGQTQGSVFDALLGGGYDFKQGRFSFGPIAYVHYTRLNVNGFTESGSLSPLALEAVKRDSLLTQLGARVSYGLPWGGALVRPDLWLTWQHEYLDPDTAIDARLASGAGSIFRVHSPEAGRDSLAVSAGITLQWSGRFTTAVFYDGELARKDHSAHGFHIGLGWSF